MKLYRQGDILIQAIKEVPAGLQKQKYDGQITLALGEATGHHHTLETGPDAADWWKADNGDQFVTLAEPARITHQEHAPIPLSPGRYRISRQREYSPEAIRNVAD